jgi:glycosyltransferase involved in cell wall biosynthesis
LAEREVERRAQWLQKLAFRRGVVPVACSKEVASSLDRRYGLKQVQVIANCIPVETYRIGSSAREEWRKAEGFSEHSILLTCVALFRQQKNHRLLLEAFASGPAQNPRVHLVLAGSGPTKLETRKQADALQISDRVHFLGLRDDIAKLLGASDVFVLASEYEGNPLAVMEAMACGIPVVSTGVGGVPELVRNGREGIIVPPGDRDALANALIFMIDHENERRAMGAKALERATKQFDVSIMVRAYENLYDQLCTPRPVMTSVLRAS